VYARKKLSHLQKVFRLIAVSPKIHPSEYLTYDDVLIYPRFSELTSRRAVATNHTVQGMDFGLPVLSANMVTVFSPQLAQAMQLGGARATLHQFDPIVTTVSLLQDLQAQGVEVIPTVGTSGDSYERTTALIEAGAKVIIVDTPHAHNSLTRDFLVWYKAKFDIPVWVGNIATPEAAADLISWGANGLKVGIGPGYACTTRIQTGVGMPQLSAVLDIVQTAKQHKDIIVIADGGISAPGQFAKALGAGADLVMIGNLFAGTDESPGHIIEQNNKQYKEYFGSASSRNREVRSTTNTAQGHKHTDYVEGASGLVPYRGSVETILTSLQHGLQSAMSYVGAKDLTEFADKTSFVKITHSGQLEGGSRVQ
jgi:IMP dehydrogenase